MSSSGASKNAALWMTRLGREGFVFRMGKLASETQTVIYAWGFLDNHAHILLRSSSYGPPPYRRSDRDLPIISSTNVA
jgi:hypothetical protein